VRRDDDARFDDGARFNDARFGDSPRVALRLAVVAVCGREKGETESLPSPLLSFAFCLLPFAFTLPSRCLHVTFTSR